MLLQCPLIKEVLLYRGAINRGIVHDVMTFKNMKIQQCEDEFEEVSEVSTPHQGQEGNILVRLLLFRLLPSRLLQFRLLNILLLFDSIYSIVIKF